MKKPLYKTLNQPIHILIGQKKDAVKRISIRPLTLFTITLITLVVAGMVGKKLFVPDSQLEQQKKTTSLQDEYLRLNAKLAETEALLSLRDAQVESMQQQLQQTNLNIQQMQQRLDLFDQVLAERKVAGVHFIRPSASWKNKHAIAYHLILVKGKNYPRWIIGHLAFTVTDAKGRSITLASTKKKNNGDKIEMTTQSFIEGELTWQPSWQPKKLTITLFNHKGRNKGHVSIPITRPNAPRTE
ncbi:MAG: hypothetical protein Q9M82_03260 [Mariprofundus sp.]|nr:hypothetical protein [Mariprofundus sp.]